MSDWTLLALVFWAFWAWDSFRRWPRARWALTHAPIGRGWRAHLSALHPVPLLPWQARLWAEDLAVCCAPDGVLNQPAGSAGRPEEPPRPERTASWEEWREVREERGALWLGSQPWAPAGGWDAAAWQKLATRLAGRPAAERERRLRAALATWLCPTHQRRRAALYLARTRWLAAVNTLTALVYALLSLLALPIDWGLPEEVLQTLVAHTPEMALVALFGHLAGCALAFRAAHQLRRWLQPGWAWKLWHAALFPPAALRLRSLLGEALRPPPHPLALLALAGPGPLLAKVGFQALADLRWPGRRTRPAWPAGQAIRAWWATIWEERVRQLLSGQGLDPEQLLQPPAPDGSASCTYCPRCRDQFVRGGECPQGIPLRPLPGRTPPA